MAESDGTPLLVLTQGEGSGGSLGWPCSSQYSGLFLVTLSMCDPACSYGSCVGGEMGARSLTSLTSGLGSWLIAIL